MPWRLLNLILLGGLAAGRGAIADDTLDEGRREGVVIRFAKEHCLDCHQGWQPDGKFDLATLLKASPLQADSAALVKWERAARKLRDRQMPPLDAARPSERQYLDAQAALESLLDEAAAKRPNPGRTLAMRRLNRSQYQNAIRDLLALEVDAAALLPKDDSSHGFDTVAVAELSPTLLSRYISAAQHVSRLAVGAVRRSVGGRTVRLPADLTQEEHVAGLPLGTRGGLLLTHTFPQGGQYDVELRLARDRNEEVEGLRGEHEMIVLVDRRQVARFTIRPPVDGNHSLVDAHLKARIDVPAGPHQLGVTFLKRPSKLLETKRQPYEARFNMHRHPRSSPALYQLSITGPYDGRGAGDTPSRRRLQMLRPRDTSDKSDKSDELASATKILRTVVRRAFRRPVDDADLQKPLRFFQQGRESGSFDDGIQLALTSVLVSPEFLFRVERDPSDVGSGENYAISDVELASRLSFFLWSSIPDEELLTTAEQGRLSDPPTLQRQVRRMLSDSRSSALITDFAAQWLQLRNLSATTPDLRRFPDFDDNLRRAFRRETELLLADVVREDRSLKSLLKSDYTYLNQRLAKHYEIPHIYGSRMRRVALPAGSHRGGLLRHGSILTVTSYATRTSPVLRGQWVLETLLGSPPPPPPADVPALKDNTVDATAPIRQRLAAHRADEACASCHNLMDPLGFSLENYDAVGRWREQESGQPVDAAGAVAGGKPFVGVAGLEQALLERPELLAATLTEKLLTYALGRGVEPHDAAAVRQVVRRAKREDFRFSSLIIGIVDSKPFRMRRTP